MNYLDCTNRASKNGVEADISATLRSSVNTEISRLEEQVKVQVSSLNDKIEALQKQLSEIASKPSHLSVEDEKIAAVPAAEIPTEPPAKAPLSTAETPTMPSESLQGNGVAPAKMDDPGSNLRDQASAESTANLTRELHQLSESQIDMEDRLSQSLESIKRLEHRVTGLDGTNEEIGTKIQRLLHSQEEANQNWKAFMQQQPHVKGMSDQELSLLTGGSYESNGSGYAPEDAVDADAEVPSKSYDVPSSAPLSLEDIEGDNEYQLQESMWDAAALIGVPGLGCWTSISLVFGIAVNFVIQSIFCLIVHANMASKEIDDEVIAAAKHWRGTVGHDYLYADHTYESSLVSRLCGSDIGLQYSSQQYQLYESLHDFLRPPPDRGVPEQLNGQVLAIISLIVWIWTVLQDVCCNGDLAWAFWNQEKSGLQAVLEVADGAIRFVSVGRLQLLSVCFVSVIPRLTVTGFLLFTGTNFLAFTGNLSELLLNAMALAFVLDIDELVFATMAPMRAKNFMRQLKSLPVSAFPHKKLRGGHHAVAVRMGLTVAFIVVTNTFLLDSVKSDMEAVTEYLCGGNVDFVVTPNKASGIIHWASSQQYKPHMERAARDYATDAVLKVAFNTSIEASGENATSIEAAGYNVIASLAVGDRKYSSNLIQCIDHLDYDSVMTAYTGVDSMYWSSLARMRDLTGNQSLSSCNDVHALDCTDPQKTAFRAICAIHCGCRSAWYGNVYSTATYGCPGACDTMYDFSLTSQIPEPFRPLVEDQCMDIDAARLLATNESGWRKYMGGVATAVRANGGSEDDVERLVRSLGENGCPALQSIKDIIMLCEEDSSGIGRSIRAYCPRSCGCNAYKSTGCPNGCRCIQGQYGLCEAGIDSRIDERAQEKGHTLIQGYLSQYFPSVFTTTTTTTFIFAKR